jgi:O-antigen/teichoic acid export membrane protein
MVTGFVGNIFLARFLEPKYFGIIALGAFIFDFVQRPKLFGLKYSLIHKQDLTESDKFTHFSLQIILSAGVVILSFLVMPLLKLKYDNDVIMVFIILAITSLFDAGGLSSTPGALLEKELLFGKVAIITIVTYTVPLLISVLLAYFGFGLWSLIWQRILLVIVPFILYWIFSPWRPKFSEYKFDKKVAVWFIKKQGIMLWIIGFFTFLMMTYDDFLVGTIVGVTALGFYSVAYNTSRMPLGFLSNFIQVALPTYSKIQKEPEKLSASYDLINGSLVRMGFLISIIIVFVAREGVLVFLGEKWLPSVILIQLLIGFSLGRPLNDGLGSILVAIGKTREYFRITLIMGVLMIFVTPVAVYFFKVNGAAVWVGILMILGAILMDGMLKKSFPFSRKKIYLYPTLTSIFTCIVGFFIFKYLLHWNSPLLMLLVKIVILSAIYISILILFERKDLIDRIKYVSAAFFVRRQDNKSKIYAEKVN